MVNDTAGLAHARLFKEDACPILLAKKKALKLMPALVSISIQEHV